MKLRYSALELVAAALQQPATIGKVRRLMTAALGAFAAR
jgi:hypothetical protein